MPKMFVIQHVPYEGLGTFEPELVRQGFEIQFCHVYKGDKLPSLEEFCEQYAGLISLGGPMSVHDQKEHKFLTAEAHLIKGLLERKKPILGVCLGAQMMAKVLGQRVFKGAQKEIGWHRVRLDDWFAKRNPLFSQIQEPLTVFQWHSEGFDIPTEGYRLAKSDLYPAQAFCYNGNAYGLQFHPEMTKEIVQSLLHEYSKQLTSEQIETITRETPTYLQALQEISQKIIVGFSSLCRNSRLA
ncbi:MAG: type 1 glutamine amidotransferase [bacterium]|nr:type 1 glutamine amidotransferase [bacterium]